MFDRPLTQEDTRALIKMAKHFVQQAKDAALVVVIAPEDTVTEHEHKTMIKVSRELDIIEEMF